jgi:hypothetical protein
MTSRQRRLRRLAVFCPTLALLGICVFLLVPVNARGAGCAAAGPCPSTQGFAPVLTQLHWQTGLALGITLVAAVVVAVAGLRQAAHGSSRARLTLIGGTVVIWVIAAINLLSVGAFLAPAAVSATAAAVLAGGSSAHLPAHP